MPDAPPRPSQIPRPQRRFAYRPDGPRQPPVLRCEWCGATFSGWPGTYGHGLWACARTLLGGD